MLGSTRTSGPVHFADSPALPSVVALGPDATQAVFSNRNKDFSQQGWDPVIGPFFKGGLMLLDFDEHMFHRRIMQEAFTRTRLTGYVEHIDSVASHVLANDWVANDPASCSTRGQGADARHRVGGVHGPRARHRPRTGHHGQPRVHHHHPRRQRDRAQAGAAVQWWRGSRRASARGLLQQRASPRSARSDGTDMFSVLCHAADEDGNTLHRRRHRQPHDLPDDGGARHLDVDADHDGLPPGRQPGVAGPLPRGVRPASATARSTSRRWRSWRPTTW